MTAARAYTYLVLAWLLVFSIIILSLIPGNRMPHFNWLDFLALDKLGHLGFYGATAWSFWKHYQQHQIPVNSWKIGIPLVLLGILLEGLQYEMHEGRSFDLLDAVANCAGVITGLNFVDGWISNIRSSLNRRRT